MTSGFGRISDITEFFRKENAKKDYFIKLSQIVGHYTDNYYHV